MAGKSISRSFLLTWAFYLWIFFKGQIQKKTIMTKNCIQKRDSFYAYQQKTDWQKYDLSFQRVTFIPLTFFTASYAQGSLKEFCCCCREKMSKRMFSNKNSVVIQYRQQPSQLLYSIDIWPARNSRLTQRETNYYITRCASELAWLYLAGRSPGQLVI